VKALIVALRAAAAITPYYTEATPPHRHRIQAPGQTFVALSSVKKPFPGRS